MHHLLDAFVVKVFTHLTHPVRIPYPKDESDKRKLHGTIYDLYSAAVPEGISQRWTHSKYGIPNVQPTWRVYISATSASLLYVWDTLERDLFADRHTLGITSAKRTTPEAAAYRPDTIVVYLLNREKAREFIKRVQKLFVGLPGRPGIRPGVPPRFTPAHFKPNVPAVTKPITGLTGFSLVQQPLDEQGLPTGGSFGDKLADLFIAAYLRANKDVAAFRKAVEEEYRNCGLNPDKPWKYSVPVSGFGGPG